LPAAVADLIGCAASSPAEFRTAFSVFRDLRASSFCCSSRATVAVALLPGAFIKAGS
jgi:hypothetical protein